MARRSTGTRKDGRKGARRTAKKTTGTARGAARARSSGGDHAAGAKGRRHVRYAVVGMGYISQAAILPAFAHAKRNSRLVALVSDDPEKQRKLARRHGAERTYGYEEYDECLASGEVDAVFIALPNSMHRDYAVRAANAGVHVLCEKPMALTEGECADMIRAAGESSVKLMIAYRLHFEGANLAAIEAVRAGKLGEPRIFTSTFTMQIEDEDNIRLKADLGGGALYDIGVYCINAARYLFRAEPEEVFAWSATRDDPRFDEVDEMTSAVLRFPDQRLASFTVSFGAADVSTYRIVGTEGDLRVEPAYEMAEDLVHHLTRKGRTREKSFPKRDQFAPELLHFSRCVLEDLDPEPGGAEGLADVRIVRALLRSAETGTPVALDIVPPPERPGAGQEIRRPPVEKPKLVRAKSPSQG